MTLRVTLFLLCCTLGAMAADTYTIPGTYQRYLQCKTALKVADNNTTGTVKELLAYNECSGYVVGFAQGLQHGGYDLKPGGAPIGALILSFVNYLNAHSAEIDAADTGSVLIKAWTADKLLRRLER